MPTCILSSTLPYPLFFPLPVVVFYEISPPISCWTIIYSRFFLFPFLGGFLCSTKGPTYDTHKWPSMLSSTHLLFILFLFWILKQLYVLGNPPPPSLTYGMHGAYVITQKITGLWSRERDRDCKRFRWNERDVTPGVLCFRWVVEPSLWYDSCVNYIPDSPTHECGWVCEGAGHFGWWVLCSDLKKKKRNEVKHRFNNIVIGRGQRRS